MAHLLCQVLDAEACPVFGFDKFMCLFGVACCFHSGNVPQRGSGTEMTETSIAVMWAVSLLKQPGIQSALGMMLCLSYNVLQFSDVATQKFFLCIFTDSTCSR